MPQPFKAGKGPFGLRTPSNLIEGRDGALYLFADASRYGTHQQWVCLLRTDEIGDPAAWRYWEGEGFEGIRRS